MRICISGSRGFKNEGAVREFVSKWSGKDDVVLVHGGCCSGVDSVVDHWARFYGIPVEVHKADWDRHGKAAGPIRNREMVKSCDYLYAFWDGSSPGTKSAVRAAEESKVPYNIILDSFSLSG